MRKHLSVAAAFVIALLGFAGTAKADNSFQLHLEPGLAQPLSAPQDQLYQTGGVLGAKGMFAVRPYLSVGPSVSAMYLPRMIDNGQNAGTIWQFAGSVRLQTDRRADGSQNTFQFVNPWVDMDLGGAQTGNLTRPVWDLGIGAEVPLDQNHIFWMGPFLRYTHIFQTSDVQDGNALDPRDVNIFQAGLSFSFDAPTRRKVVVRHDVRTVERVDYHPCPPPQEVAVASPPEKVNLSERVYFDFDSSKLRWESRDKLDAVVAELKKHPSLKIHVEGHASSDGNKLHNVKLSGERTAAVVMYLVQHGVDASRLEGVAMGIDHPATPPQRIVAFTGHRPDKLGGYKLPNPVYVGVCKQIQTTLRNYQPTKVISGMALGVDQWAAVVAYRMGIPFLAAIPFEGQEKAWPEKSQKTYRLLRRLASEEKIISPGDYSAAKMQIRNEWMVDNCHLLIAVWDGSKGGTRNCIEYAESIKREIFYIDPSIFRE